MADLADFSSREREAQLRSVSGVDMAPGSGEPFIGRDEAGLLADPSIERINTMPVDAPQIVLEE